MSTAADVSYKEMTLHCESLMMGKQEKMSYLMNTQHKQESLLITFSQNSDDKEKIMISHVQSGRGFHLVISCSSFLKYKGLNNLHCVNFSFILLFDHLLIIQK